LFYVGFVCEVELMGDGLSYGVMFFELVLEVVFVFGFDLGVYFVCGVVCDVCGEIWVC